MPYQFRRIGKLSQNVDAVRFGFLGRVILGAVACLARRTVGAIGLAAVRLAASVLALLLSRFRLRLLPRQRHAGRQAAVDRGHDAVLSIVGDRAVSHGCGDQGRANRVLAQMFAADQLPQAVGG